MLFQYAEESTPGNSKKFPDCRVQSFRKVCMLVEWSESNTQERFRRSQRGNKNP